MVHDGPLRAGRAVSDGVRHTVNDWCCWRVLSAVRRKTILILAGLAAAGVAATQWLPSPQPPSAERRMEPAQRGEAAKPAPVVAALPEREPLPKPAGQPFRPQSWEAPAPKVAPQSIEPLRTPVPYRVAGTVTYATGPEIVLVKGNRVVVVREGDTLEDGYKVDEVGPDHVTLVYLPAGTVERLPLASASDAPVSAAAGASQAPLAPSPLLPPLPPPLPVLQR